MFTAGTLILVLLSNQGYWFGGQESTITVRRAARGELPGVDLSWRLWLGAAPLANGSLALARGQDEARLRIIPPEVRARNIFRWAYSLKDHETGADLGGGESRVAVFPDDLLDGLSRRIAGRRLSVYDRPQSLPRILDRAGVPC